MVTIMAVVEEWGVYGGSPPLPYALAAPPPRWPDRQLACRNRAALTEALGCPVESRRWRIEHLRRVWRMEGASSGKVSLRGLVAGGSHLGEVEVHRTVVGYHLTGPVVKTPRSSSTTGVSTATSGVPGTRRASKGMAAVPPPLQVGSRLWRRLTGQPPLSSHA